MKQLKTIHLSCSSTALRDTLWVTAPTSRANNRESAVTSTWHAVSQLAAWPHHLTERADNTSICTVSWCVTTVSLPKQILTSFTHNQDSIFLARTHTRAWKRWIWGAGGNTLISGINQDEIEQSILTITEAFQSLPAQCVPQQPCDNALMLAESMPGARRSRVLHPFVETHSKVRSTCCFLATWQSHNKSDLPVCMGTNSRQLVQEVHENISSPA